MRNARLESLGHALIIVNPVAQSGAAAGAAERLKRFLTMYCHREAFDIAQTDAPDMRRSLRPRRQNSTPCSHSAATVRCTR